MSNLSGQMTVRRFMSLLLVAALAASLLAFLPAATAAQESSQQGKFIVMFKEQPNPSKYATISDLSARRWAIYNDAVDLAERVQVGVRSYLQQKQQLGKVKSVTPLWIVNAISFEGEVSVANEIGLRPEVDSVSTDEAIVIPEDEGGLRANFWHHVQTNVPEVWAESFDGGGVTVGLVDTGAEVTHPALETKYRGYVTKNSWDNNYNWADFVEGKRHPQDANGHGTHVLASIVGGDGPGPGAPDTGAAYRAKWMGARAFDANGAGTTTKVLLASAYILAPTDVDGEKPRPDLAPDVVNNSWGTVAGCRLWYSLVLDMWRAANIFPVFSVGNDGNLGERSVSSPGDLDAAMGIGASDENDARLSFSGQGPSVCSVPTQTKPDIVAPGVGIYSATHAADCNGNPECYTQRSGTSMAAPQVAAAAALMIQAAGGPGALTVALNHIDDALIASAFHPPGWTACNNQIGCGRLDVFAAVQAVRANGVLTGTVQNTSGSPIPGAKIALVGGPGSIARNTTTDIAGTYRIGNLRAGTYSVTARAWSYVAQTVSVAIPVAPTTVIQNFILATAPTRTLTGRVSRFGSGDPVSGVKVKIKEAPSTFPVALTNSLGDYTLSAVPEETYTLEVTGDRCSLGETVTGVVVDAPPNVQNVTLPFKRDGFGYFCQPEPIHFQPGSTVLPLNGDDEATSVSLPFLFPFYNSRRSTAFVSTNGFITFDTGSTDFSNGKIPDLGTPNSAVYPFWDDLRMDGPSKILVGSPTEDSFVIEWRDMTFAPFFTIRTTFSVTLHKNGDIEFQYKLADENPARGGGATVGLEDDNGLRGFQYSFNEQVLYTGLSILWSPALEPSWLRGTVKDSITSATLAGARLVAVSSSGTPRTTFADSGGKYRFTLNAAPYTITASIFHYFPGTESLTLPHGVLTLQDFPLERMDGFIVSGIVRDENGDPIPNLPVTLGVAAIPDTTTNGSGAYSFSDVPAGLYDLGNTGSGRCRRRITVPLNVTGPTTQDFTVPALKELTIGSATPYGYTCRDDIPLAPIDRSLAEPTSLKGDNATLAVSIPFSFPFYGVGRNVAYVSTNGLIRFDAPSSDPSNVSIPQQAVPNLALYPFWDDLNVDGAAAVLTRGGPDFFAIEWRNVAFFINDGIRLSFEVVLHPSGDFEFNYITADATNLASGTSATIGIENQFGNVGFRYAVDTSAVKTGHRVAFTIARGALVGSVREADTNKPIGGAELIVDDGSLTFFASTNSTGGFGVAVPPGTYSVSAYKYGFVRKTVTGVVVLANRPTQLDILLDRAPTHGVAGTVLDQESMPVPNITIDIYDTFAAPTKVLSLKTNQLGVYAATIPEETYEVRLAGSGRCQNATPSTLVVTGPTTHNISATVNRDLYGYACLERNQIYIGGGTAVRFANENTVIPIPLTFPVTLYGMTSQVLFVNPNGSAQLGGLPLGLMGAPSFDVFKGVTVDSASELAIGQPPGTPSGSAFVIEWRNMLVKRKFLDDTEGLAGQRVTFSLLLRADGTFSYFYKPPSKPLPTGTVAHVGVQDACGNSVLSYYETSLATAPSLTPRLVLDFNLRYTTDPLYVPC